MSIRAKVSLAPVSGLVGGSPQDQEALLRVFWHRGRRCAVEWTAGELMRRAGLSPDRTSTALRMLSMRGLTVSRHQGGFNLSYALNDRGVALLLSLMMCRAGGDA